MKTRYHHTEETKKKISLGQQNRPPISEKTRQKMRDAWKTRPPVSEETKQKMSLAGKNKTPPSDETRHRLSEAGKKRAPPSQETKNKISESLKQLPPITEETRERLSKVQTGRKHSPETIKKMSKENCHLWKGGISFEPYCPKFNNDLRRRIRAFFEHQCIICGKHENECNRKHCCHHVEYNKEACCDGKPVHFAAICIKHHAITNSDRERWEAIIHRIIDEIYEGKSYYTQEEYKELIKNGKD